MRAYKIDPSNPMINLTIGLTHIHRGHKTHSGIQQPDILHALTFIFRYHEIRMESEHLEERLEAHYNVARTYQLLGMTHLAVPYYQKVLNEAEGRKVDLVTETAFNLQNVYTLAGNMELARKITNKYLVL